MAIKLDIGPCTVVIYCTDCPHWRALRFTKHEAHDAAVAHEKLAHPGEKQAQKAASIFRIRNEAVPEM